MSGVIFGPDHPTTAPFEAHDWEHIDEEYGSLGDGGSYDVYRCRGCGKRSYSPMAD
jgi:hypothetical protein